MDSPIALACENCNSPLTGGEFFCPICGHQVRAVGEDAPYTSECRLCGTSLPAVGAKCPACGYDVATPGAVIMIVDDSLDMVEMLEEIFRLEGYHSIHCSGSEAVAVASVRQPDLILLDVQMPDVDGLTVLEHLRDAERTRDIPVILTSASLRLRLLARDVEVEGRVEKPFDLSSLTSEVARLLQERREHREAQV